MEDMYILAKTSTRMYSLRPQNIHLACCKKFMRSDRERKYTSRNVRKLTYYYN